MKSKVRFLPFVIALALITSMFVFSPASAATGTVSLDKSFITTPGGTLTITLTDSDLNTGVTQVDELQGRDITNPAKKAIYRIPGTVTIPAGGELRFRTSKSPILDASEAALGVDLDGSGGDLSTTSDGGVDFQDIVVSAVAGTLAPEIFQFEQMTLPTGAVNIPAAAGSGAVRHAFDVFSVGGGIFVLRNWGEAFTPFTDIDFQVTYVAPDVQTHNVKVASTQDATGYSIVLVETGASTGVFKATFTTAATTVNAIDIDNGGVGVAENDPLLGPAGLDLDGSGLIDGTLVAVTTEANIGIDVDGDGALEAVATITSIPGSLIPNRAIRPSIASVTGALITVSYDDAGTSRVANATVETTKPSITILAPSHDTATRTQSTRLIAEVTDADSGVDNATVNFQIGIAETPGGAPVAGITTIARTLTSVPGGVRIEAQFSNVPTGENIINWRVTATDIAGNITTSDQDGDATNGNQDHQIRIDTVAPGLGTINVGGRTITGAITGHNLDAENVAVTAADAADPTFVRVVFNEALNQNSLQASDFRVGGVAPADVIWSSKHPESVFLKVPTRAADAKPVVDVVGSVEDRALNAVPGGLTTPSLDGIAPTVTVTLSPSLRLSTGTFTIDMQSNEALLTAPVITLNGNEWSEEGGNGVGGGDLSATSLIGANLFRATVTASTKPMRFNIQVDSRDTSDNKRTAGTVKAEDDNSISFEVDNVLPAPVVEFPGGDAANVYTQNPFIVIDWASEAAEYGRAGNKLFNTSTASAAYDTVLDTKSLVTITSITVDGSAVSSNMNRVNNGKFLLALRDVSLAEHKLTFTGQDAAGNTLEIKDTTFTVKERPPFAVNMTPGWNLVSLPAQPKSGAINDVIPSGHSASIVITYDPKEAGGWLTATRGDDGLFAGTLTQIKASRAYWIFTESFDAINVPLQVIGGGTTNLLPTVNLVAGWNMLSVLDVSGTKVFGDAVTTPGAYVGAAVARTYEYNAFNDRFDAVAAGGANVNVKVGQGYWVYLTAATTLVP